MSILISCIYYLFQLFQCSLIFLLGSKMPTKHNGFMKIKERCVLGVKFCPFPNQLWKKSRNSLMICKIPGPDIPHILVVQVDKRTSDQPPKLKLIGCGQSDSWLSTKNFRIIRRMRPTFSCLIFFICLSTTNEIKSPPNWHSLVDGSNSKNLQIYFR